MKSKAIAAAAKDPTSLGNLFISDGIIDQDQLKMAIQFQCDNPDLMLGEALIHMGVIERSMLEEMIIRQQAVRGQSRKAVSQLVELATNRTKEFTNELKGFVTYVTAHTEK